MADPLLEALGPLPEAGPPALIVDRVTAVFEALHDPADQAGVQRFMPGLDFAYGLRVPRLRQLGKLVGRQYRADPDLGRSVALASWARSTREHRLFALFLLEHVDLPSADLWELGERFLPDCVTWEDVDQLCGPTFARAVCSDPTYLDQLEPWLAADNHWVRRAVLVTTAYLRRCDFPAGLALALDERALSWCSRLLDDSEPYVRKAVDWAAREALRRHYELGRDWLFEQASAGPSRSARTILKLIGKKLNEADQAAFLDLLETG